MQALARTTPRAHIKCVLRRTIHNTALLSEATHSPSNPVSEAEPESEPPQKIYPRLPEPASFSLSQSKLRALIDLYHSSSSFITPENLSSEIDKTFAPTRLTSNLVRYDSYNDLIERRNTLVAEPDRIVPTANEMQGAYATFDGVGTEGWSASKGERARMVKAALWGVDPMAKIGLETLLEAKAEMDQFSEAAQGGQANKDDSEKAQ